MTLLTFLALGSCILSLSSPSRSYPAVFLSPSVQAASVSVPSDRDKSTATLAASKHNPNSNSIFDVHTDLTPTVSAAACTEILDCSQCGGSVVQRPDGTKVHCAWLTCSLSPSSSSSSRSSSSLSASATSGSTSGDSANLVPNELSSGACVEESDLLAGPTWASNPLCSWSFDKHTCALPDHSRLPKSIISKESTSSPVESAPARTPSTTTTNGPSSTSNTRSQSHSNPSVLTASSSSASSSSSSIPTKKRPDMRARCSEIASCGDCVSASEYDPITKRFIQCYWMDCSRNSSLSSASSSHPARFCDSESNLYGGHQWGSKQCSFGLGCSAPEESSSPSSQTTAEEPRSSPSNSNSRATKTTHSANSADSVDSTSPFSSTASSPSTSTSTTSSSTSPSLHENPCRDIDTCSQCSGRIQPDSQGKKHFCFWVSCGSSHFCDTEANLLSGVNWSSHGCSWSFQSSLCTSDATSESATSSSSATNLPFSSLSSSASSSSSSGISSRISSASSTVISSSSSSSSSTSPSSFSSYNDNPRLMNPSSDRNRNSDRNRIGAAAADSKSQPDPYNPASEPHHLR